MRDVARSGDEDVKGSGALNLNVIVAGIVSGLLYGLCGISLVIVYRASRLINFALGGLGGIAAYLAFSLLGHGIPYPVAYIAALAVGGLIGWATEWFVVRRLAGKQHIVVGIATLGVLLILQGVMVLVWGTDTQALRVPFGANRGISLGTIVLSGNELFILC